MATDESSRERDCEDKVGLTPDSDSDEPRFTTWALKSLVFSIGAVGGGAVWCATWRLIVAVFTSFPNSKGPIYVNIGTLLGTLLLAITVTIIVPAAMASRFKLGSRKVYDPEDSRPIIGTLSILSIVLALVWGSGFLLLLLPSLPSLVLCVWFGGTIAVYTLFHTECDVNESVKGCVAWRDRLTEATRRWDEPEMPFKEGIIPECQLHQATVSALDERIKILTTRNAKESVQHVPDTPSERDGRALRELQNEPIDALL